MVSKHIARNHVAKQMLTLLHVFMTVDNMNTFISQKSRHLMSLTSK